MRLSLILAKAENRVACDPGGQRGQRCRFVRNPTSTSERTMGLYSEHVLPRIVDVACNMKEARPQRRRVCDGLAGSVVEIGFGSGLNVPFYPASVTQVTAVEPADVAWKLASKRLRETRLPVHRSGLDAETLPFPDDSFDAALSTWTMCTIPDIAAALRELRRVLKPDGALHFVEHGLAPDEGVRRWQHRLDPVQQRVFGGCHLTRPVAELLRQAGFAISELDVYYEKGTPKVFGANSLGVACPV
jgi:SAM-dependent methyltransferase